MVNEPKTCPKNVKIRRRVLEQWDQETRRDSRRGLAQSVIFNLLGKAF